MRCSRPTALSGEQGRHFDGERLSEAECITGVTSAVPYIIVGIIRKYTLPIGGNSYHFSNAFHL